MLRRKFLFNLAPLVLVIVLTAVCAILVLQNTMRAIHQFQAQGASIEEISSKLVQLRWLILALVGAFLMEINFCVLVMLRMAAMILHPVDALVVATEELGHDHYDYRVRIPNSDEFGQLAEAYNHLAEQLEANEERKVETLHQVAAALNHDLNNAVTTVDLQLRLLRRRIENKEDLERCLQQISTGLGRMTKTVQSLKNIRRIVLTDYPGGTKMLDIERSSRIEWPSDNTGLTRL